MNKTLSLIELFDRAAACIANDRRKQFGKNLERNAHKASRAAWSHKQEYI